jgi:hypothetical protein
MLSAMSVHQSKWQRDVVALHFVNLLLRLTNGRAEEPSVLRSRLRAGSSIMVALAAAWRQATHMAARVVVKTRRGGE